MGPMHVVCRAYRIMLASKSHTIHGAQIANGVTQTHRKIRMSIVRQDLRGYVLETNTVYQHTAQVDTHTHKEATVSTNLSLSYESFSDDTALWFLSVNSESGGQNNSSLSAQKFLDDRVHTWSSGSKHSIVEPVFFWWTK